MRAPVKPVVGARRESGATARIEVRARSRVRQARELPREASRRRARILILPGRECASRASSPRRGVYVARGEVLSGSRAPTCVSFGARDGVFSVWGRGGKPGERRFGMKTSSAHGARDRIRRPHPPGGCNHPHFCRNNVFLIFWRAGGGVRALARRAAACVCSAATVGGRGRPQVQPELRDARRTSSASYCEQVSVCVIVFFISLARAVSRRQK